MTGRCRIVAAIVLVTMAALVSSCVTSPKSQETAAHRPLQPDYSYWPHEISDLKPDPGVRYGVLANGMRYAIMRNSQPEGAVSLKLRIAAGSLQETDPQQGLAHFLEHMAFSGSRNVPEGEFVKLLQRKGLAFGAHTNAYTSTDETVYMLELPRNTPDLIDTGLMLFREVGENLLLDPAAVEREKGVVLSEMRTSNTPEFRASVARTKVWYEGQLLANRMPIGKKETVEAATHDLLAEFYHRNYRPERSLLVVTGDIDPADMEKIITARFADWKGQGLDVPDPDLGTPKQRGLVTAAHIEANLGENVTMTWFQAAGWEADTLQVRTRDSRWWMATAILNRRLGRIARGDNPPFVSANVGRDTTRGVLSTFGINVSCKPGTWKVGIAAAEQELRRALQFGFSDAEVSRELKEWRASLENAAGSASTRTTSALASSLVAQFSNGNVFTDPAQDLAIFDKYAPALTPQAVLKGLKDVAQGYGPVVVVSSSEAMKGGDAEIAVAYDASQKTAVAAVTKAAGKQFPYTSFGKEGAVASRQHVDDLDISLVRFSNGVRLNFKKTSFEKDRINASVRFAGGFISLPKGKPGMYWLLPFSFNEGGLKKLTKDEMEESLAGKVVSFSLRLDDNAFQFDGATRSQDFLLQMQLMAAYATDPAYRSYGLERQMATADSDIKQFSASPGRVLSREASGLLHSGDRRWVYPTLVQLQAIRMADITAVMAPALARAPIEVSIVGDTTEGEAIRVVATTFGALPDRLAAPTESAGARAVKFPTAGARLEFRHEGPSDQAAASAAWPTQDFYANMRQSRAINLLRDMINVRLTDEFREAQGATYLPSVESSLSTAFKWYGYVFVSVETKPELVDGFFKTLDRVVEEMRSGSFPDDVVDRAQTPMVKSMEKSRLGNGFWQGVLIDLQTEPRGLEAVRTQLNDYTTLTRQDVIAAAQRFLVPGRRIDVRILPKKPQAAL